LVWELERMLGIGTPEPLSQTAGAPVRDDIQREYGSVVVVVAAHMGISACAL
jgi:hypothetical protein